MSLSEAPRLSHASRAASLGGKLPLERLHRTFFPFEPSFRLVLRGSDQAMPEGNRVLGADHDGNRPKPSVSEDHADRARLVLDHDLGQGDGTKAGRIGDDLSLYHPVGDAEIAAFRERRRKSAENDARVLGVEIDHHWRRVPWVDPDCERAIAPAQQLNALHLALPEKRHLGTFPGRRNSRANLLATLRELASFVVAIGFIALMVAVL